MRCCAPQFRPVQTSIQLPGVEEAVQVAQIDGVRRLVERGCVARIDRANRFSAIHPAAAIAISSAAMRARSGRPVGLMV